ncbi:uncharacterized protein [Primulina huaijiensis]|uniref:uncharacterized protein isoform X2 n=1 Tax=Primulina huaijiensis TaxID=1492673 RepID=UPI003CC6E09F
MPLATLSLSLSPRDTSNPNNRIPMASRSLYSHSKVSFGFRGKQTRELVNTGTIKHGSLCCYAPGVLALIYTNTSIASKPLRFNWSSIKASASSGRSRSSSSRRVYNQSQAQPSVAIVKQMASSVLPAGVFAVVIFGRDFGDEGLFFLAESLAYNQVAEDVNFCCKWDNC